MIVVIHIISDADLSGAPVHVLSLVKGLDKKQFNPIVIGPRGPAEKVFQEAGLEYQTFDFGSKFNLFAIARLRQHIQDLTRGKSTILHCHGPRAGLFTRLATHSLPYSVVYTEHSWTADYHLPNKLNEMTQLVLLRYLDRYTTKTIAVSDSVKDFLLKAKVTTAEKLERIYNGIELPKELPKLNDRKTIGSVGSLTERKNYSWLVELMPGIIREVPDATLEIIGEGEEEPALRALINRLGLTGLVKLVGSVPHEKLPAHYERWGLYLQPSLNESFGLALAEAIAAGLPTLSSNLQSTREVIGTDSGLFDLTDKEKALQKIVKYLKNDDLRATLQNEQWAHIQQFSLENMLKAYEKLYASIISEA